MSKNERLANKFDSSLKTPDCVRVESFYKSLKKENSSIKWNDKMKDSDKFKEFLDKTTDVLEVLAEGYRCLCQIHINLIRDFDIFKEYPIRKYSSAFNYISKVGGFREILAKIGYKEDDMKFNLKVDKLQDLRGATETALDLLICFMEIMELYHLKTTEIPISLLVVKREKAIEEEIDTNMSDGEKAKKFSKCDHCASEVGTNGECTVCGSCVTEFSFAWKYKDYIQRTYPKVDISKIISPIVEKTPARVADVAPQRPRRGDAPVKVAPNNEAEWSCPACTFKNPALSLNCGVCGNTK